MPTTPLISEAFLSGSPMTSFLSNIYMDYYPLTQGRLIYSANLSPPPRDSFLKHSSLGAVIVIMYMKLLTKDPLLPSDRWTYCLPSLLFWDVTDGAILKHPQVDYEN